MRLDTTHDAVAALHAHRLEHAVFQIAFLHIADEHIGALLIAQGEELGHRRRRAAKFRTAMDQHHAVRVVDERQRPIERRVAAAENQHVLIGERARILHAIVQILAFDLRCAGHIESTGLERAHATCDHDSARIEHRLRAGDDPEATIFLTLDLRDFLTEMQTGAERLDLLEQSIGELLTRAHGHGRNVVDGLVGIELDALTAWRFQRIDHMSLETEQSQFEHLEQAARTRPDDHDIRLDGMPLELKR